LGFTLHPRAGGQGPGAKGRVKGRGILFS
jgi:hypothetical protein